MLDEKVDSTGVSGEKLERTRSKTAEKKLVTAPAKVRREREKLLRMVEEAAKKRKMEQKDDA